MPRLALKGIRMVLVIRTACAAAHGLAGNPLRSSYADKPPPVLGLAGAEVPRGQPNGAKLAGRVGWPLATHPPPPPPPISPHLQLFFWGLVPSCRCIATSSTRPQSEIASCHRNVRATWRASLDSDHAGTGARAVVHVRIHRGKHNGSSSAGCMPGGSGGSPAI